LLVAELDGCCYLLNPRVLALQCLPAVIDFQESESGLSPCWATEAVTQVCPIVMTYYTCTLFIIAPVESDLSLLA
jgi:hypothetical protein